MRPLITAADAIAVVSDLLACPEQLLLFNQLRDLHFSSLSDGSCGKRFDLCSAASAEENAFDGIRTVHSS